jgi:hypothetical protein
MRESISAYRALVGRPDGRRQLGRPRHKREDNIKLVFKKWGDVDFTGLAHNRER